MKSRKIKTIKFHNRLVAQVYCYFAIIVLVATVVIGTLFLKLYQNNSLRNYSQDLEVTARSIASRMTEFVQDKDYRGYSSYMEILEGIEASDIWIVSNGKENGMEDRFENTKLEGVELNEYVDQVIQNAFQGKYTYTTTSDNMYEEVVMTLAVPIDDGFGHAIGAVVMNSFIDGYENTVTRSTVIILYACLGGMIAAFILSAVFAGRLTKPILELKDVADRLSHGDYEARTTFRRKDELGDLGNTMNVLSRQLSVGDEERRNMEQTRLDFFANVSHELRTPITVIRGYTETLADGMVTDGEKVQQYYERMLIECKSMERLVGDLLVLSKMQNPDFIIDKETIDLVELLEELIRGADVMCRDKNITLHFDNEEEYCLISGDYDRLRQMFFVILDNAVKFTGEGKNIWIRLEKKERVYVSIRDEGVGITPQEMENIFDKFYKSKLRQNAKGSGLGLAIAKQIALKHGGDIRVESEVGKGSCFEFDFEVVSEE